MKRREKCGLEIEISYVETYSVLTYEFRTKTVVSARCLSQM